MSDHRSACPGTAVEELFDPQSEQYLENPYRVFREARLSCPVARIGSGDEFVVTGHEEIMQVQRDYDRFTSRHNLDGVYPFAEEALSILNNSLFFRVAKLIVDPPEHTPFRNFISAYFSPRRLKAMEPFIRSLASQLVAGFAAGGKADLLAQYAYPLPMTVISELIGIPEADRATVKAWNNAWLALQVAPLTPEQQVQCAQASVAYETYLGELLARLRREPADDLLSHFAVETAKDDPVCTVEDVIVAVRVMIAAGHETTSNLIANAMFHLLDDRSRWQTLVADPGLAAAAAEEAMRFDPSVQAAPRTATEDIELGGVKIPAGSKIHSMFAAAGRDPNWVDDPDSFRLDREGPPRHFGFGYGVHHCVGAQLARLESRIALETLARELPDMALEPGFVPVHLPAGFVFRGLASLPVTWPVPVATAQPATAH